MTQHVLYFWKAGGSRISHMTTDPDPTTMSPFPVSHRQVADLSNSIWSSLLWAVRMFLEDLAFWSAELPSPRIVCDLECLSRVTAKPNCLIVSKNRIHCYPEPNCSQLADPPSMAFFLQHAPHCPRMHCTCQYHHHLILWFFSFLESGKAKVKEGKINLI